MSDTQLVDATISLLPVFIPAALVFFAMGSVATVLLSRRHSRRAASLHLKTADLARKTLQCCLCSTLRSCRQAATMNILAGCPRRRK